MRANVRPSAGRARLAALLAIAALFTGCASETSGPSVRVATIELSPSNPTLTSLGQTLQLNAGLLTAGGEPTTARGTMAWTTSNSGVASVSGSGAVTAVSNGTATITAAVDGVQGTTQVTVTQAVANVVVTSPATSFASLQVTSQYGAAAYDALNNAVTGVAITWSSTSTGVATVSTAGLVRSIGNGTAGIIAAAGTMADTVTVTVAQVATSVTLAGYTALNGYNQTDQLTATARDANSQVATSQAFTWTSSSSAVASVSSSGLVTAQDEGSATITATATGTSASATQVYPIAFAIASNQTVTGNISDITDTDTYDWPTSAGAQFVTWVYGATSKTLVFAPQASGTGSRVSAPRSTGAIIAGSDAGAAQPVITVGGSTGDFTLAVATTCFEFSQRGPAAFVLSDGLLAGDCGVLSANTVPTASASSLAKATTVPVLLTGGQTYTFKLSSTVFDAYLMVFGPDGSAWWDDDSGPLTDSRLVITAPVTGLYTFVLTSYSPNTLGAFTLDVSLGNNPVGEALTGSAPAAAVRTAADEADARRRAPWLERSRSMGPIAPSPTPAAIK